MIYAFICRRCGDLPVAACCRVGRPDARRAAPGPGRALQPQASRAADAPVRRGGIHRCTTKGCTRRVTAAEAAEDLVKRCFDPAEPDRLWTMDVTKHPAAEGKVYVAVVLDGFSRMVVGWSISDHMRAELVVDALQMAAWRRQPAPNQTVGHSDHGSQYTSWAFEGRRRAARLLGSMGSIGDCFDNSVVESFFGTLQVELLDQTRWQSRQQLALSVFEWIEAWYNPRRRSSYCSMLSPDYEAAHRSRRLGSAA